MDRGALNRKSLVIIGDSRAWFDVDLDEFQKGLGKRPIQLAMAGSTVLPALADLADDKNFHGTIICSVVPHLFFAPTGSPPMDRAEKGVKRFHNQTPAQRVSEYLAMPLEENVAFLKPDDLSLEALLNQLPIPNRPGALVPPRFPPYFQTEDRERRARRGPRGSAARRRASRRDAGVRAVPRHVHREPARRRHRRQQRAGHRDHGEPRQERSSGRFHL